VLLATHFESNSKRSRSINKDLKIAKYFCNQVAIFDTLIDALPPAYFSGRKTSKPPIYGRSTSGTMTVPSAC